MVISRQEATVAASAVSIMLIPLIAGSNILFDRTLDKLSIDFDVSAKALTKPARALKSIDYKPPNRGAPSSTVAGGARLRPATEIQDGGERTGTIPPPCSQPLVVFLVPQSHAGQTVSGRPTFFWYLSDPKVKTVEFNLKKAGAQESIFSNERVDIPAAGIIKLKIPENVPELTEGQDYVWSVSSVCVDKGVVKKRVALAGITRVAPTSELTKQLTSAKSESDRAKAYAQQGYWYDALEALSKASDAKPEDPSIVEDFYSLLKQVGLDGVVEQVRQQS